MGFLRATVDDEGFRLLISAPAACVKRIARRRVYVPRATLYWLGFPWKRDGKWSCAEVELNRSLGYGTYVMVVRDTSHLEPAAVLSMNTFDDCGGDQHYRKIDVEMSRSDDAANKNNAQYGIQPFYVPGNAAAFTAPSGTLTHSMHWEPGLARFKTVRGNAMTAGAPVVSEHVSTCGRAFSRTGKDSVLVLCGRP